jgi:hypothetical protein
MAIDKKDFWLEKLKNHPRCIKQREEFFRLLEFLESPKDSRKYINHIERGNKEEQQTHTYNELALGYLLKKNGYTLEYEKKINFQSKVKTPDWFISASEANPEFIVEIFTTYTGSDDKTRSENLQIALLKKRLEKINFDGVLCIRCDSSKLDSRRIKEIAKKIELILTSRYLIYNFEYEDQDLGFGYELMKSNIGLLRLKVLMIEDFRKISQETLLRNISEKTKRYKNGSIPLVIATFTDMGISQQIKEERIDCLKDSVSAFIWIDRVHPSVDGWIINIMYNTKSKLKLKNIFKNERHVFSNSNVIYHQVIQETVLNYSEHYDIVQKGLKETNFNLILENQSNIRKYCHWITPIHTIDEFVLVIPPRSKF